YRLYVRIRRGDAVAETHRLEALGWKLSPLCLAAAIPLLFQWQMWKGRDVEFLLIALITGFCAQKLFYRALDAPLLSPGRERPRLAVLKARLASRLERATPWLTWVIVTLVFVGYASYFSFYTVQNHWNLRTAACDMAIVDNVVFN